MKMHQCMYEDACIEVHQPLDDSQVTLPIRVNPEKQLYVILVPHTTTRQSSPVVPEFVSQNIVPFDHHAQHQQMLKDRRVVSEIIRSSSSSSSSILVS